MVDAGAGPVQPFDRRRLRRAGRSPPARWAAGATAAAIAVVALIGGVRLAAAHGQRGQGEHRGRGPAAPAGETVT